MKILTTTITAAALLAVTGCGTSPSPPTSEETTRLCSAVLGHRFVLQKYRTEQRGILAGQRDATAKEMELLVLRIKAAEASITLAEYKAQERGIDPARCAP